MFNVLGLFFIALCLLGCDSFPKKMHVEKIGAPVTDQVRITTECSSMAHSTWMADTYSVYIHLYIINSGPTDIHFKPATLLSTTSPNVEFEFARGGHDAIKKSAMSKSKPVVIAPGADLLVDLFFDLKDKSQFQKVAFDISGIYVGKQKRATESFNCRQKPLAN